MKALIVDDDDIFLTEISFCLSMLGWENDKSSNGYEAIKYLQQERYDLIITDIMMSEMSGVKLIDYIKTKYTTPILVMTCFDIEKFDKKKYPYIWNKNGLNVLIDLVEKIMKNGKD